MMPRCSGSRPPSRGTRQRCAHERAESCRRTPMASTAPAGGSHMTELAALLEAVALFVRQYVVCSPAQLVAIVLWVAHTHALDAFDVTPYLNIKSAEPESGKTRLLDLLRCV